MIEEVYKIDKEHVVWKMSHEHGVKFLLTKGVTKILSETGSIEKLEFPTKKLKKKAFKQLGIKKTKKVLACTLNVGDKIKYKGCVAEVTKKTFEYGRTQIYISYWDWYMKLKFLIQKIK